MPSLAKTLKDSREMKMRLHKKIGRLIRQKLRNRILANHGTGILAETWNGNLLVEAGDFSVGRKLLKDGAYDKNQITWLLDSIATPTETIIVVGAHIGALLVPLSRSTKKIIGYEPDKTNFDLLSKNLLLNTVSNAEIINAAVGASPGVVALKRNRLNTGNTSVDVYGSQSNSQTNMVTLDRSLVGTTCVDLMVMDIEGHEKHALDGGTQTIERTEKLYVEFAPEQLSEHRTDPCDLLQTLADAFPYVYTHNNNLTCNDSKEGCREIRERMNSRGFLINLLFSKSAIPAGR